MNPPNLKTAILEFLGNEFKLEPKNIGEDLNFITDLNLDPGGLSDLLQRMQDALDFTLPDDKGRSLATLEDLFMALDLNPPDPADPAAA